MNCDEIIRALVLIRDTCASSTCENCPFRRDDNETCGITNGVPSMWEIEHDTNWRAFI